MALNKLQKLFISIFSKFTDEIFKEAEKETIPMLQQQKKDRDSILSYIASIILKYKVIDTFISLTNSEYKKEKKKLDTLVTDIAKSEYKSENTKITQILTNAADNKYKSSNFLIKDYKNSRLKADDLKKIISENVKGENYSKRLWKGKRKLLEETLQKEIKKFLQGKTNINDIENIIKSKFNANAYNTKRLVITETAKVQAATNDKWCKDNNIESVIYSATLDNRTTEFCKIHDNIIYKVNDSNKPFLPHHPNCRSTYLPIIEGGFQPNINSKTSWKDYKNN